MGVAKARLLERVTYVHAFRGPTIALALGTAGSCQDRLYHNEFGPGWLASGVWFKKVIRGPCHCRDTESIATTSPRRPLPAAGSLTVSRELEDLLSKGKVDEAVRLAEECWGQGPDLGDRVTHLLDFLQTEYHNSLEPAPCRLVYFNFDDPSETMREPGNLTVWVELHENTPTEEEFDAAAGGGAQYSLPIYDLKQSELTVIYGIRLGLRVMKQLRSRKHPLGSAEFRVGLHSGDDYTLLNKIRAFPCHFDFESRLQEIQSALDCGHRQRAGELLTRMPGNLKKTQREACRRLESRLLAYAEQASTLPEVERALLEIGTLRSGHRLVRQLRLRAAQLHLAEGQTLKALREYYSIGQESPAEAFLGLELPNVRVVKDRPRPTYFFADQDDLCTFGLAEIVDDRLERGLTATLPRAVYQILDQMCQFFSPRDASEALTQAAYHAFQAGFGSYARYLARKASEFNPMNATAQGSLNTLQAKGIVESGQERHCLEILMASRPMSLFALQAHGLHLE